MEVDCIKRLRTQITARVQHSFKKRNTLTEYFSSLVFCFVGKFYFSHFHELSSKGMKIITLDKLVVPHIRRQQQ